VKTRFVSLALIAALFALSSAAFAQSFVDVNQGSAPEGVTIPGTGDLLWDNTQIAATTAGIVSTRALGLPVGAQEAQTADDFTVPAGLTWTIDFVYSEGFISAGSPSVDSFAVIFYADAGGAPGAVVAEEIVVAGGAVNDTTQEFALASPVQLTGGTYWVSIVGEFQGSTGLATGRWNWTTGPTAIDNEASLQDTAGFFGAPLPWTPLSVLGVTDPSAFFALRGTATNALPESVPVPTLSQWSLILLVLALAGVAGTVLIRRA
jgi:hypothetical protein